MIGNSNANSVPGPWQRVWYDTTGSGLSATTEQTTTLPSTSGWSSVSEIMVVVRCNENNAGFNPTIVCTQGIRPASTIYYAIDGWNAITCNGTDATGTSSGITIQLTSENKFKIVARTSSSNSRLWAM